MEEGQLLQWALGAVAVVVTALATVVVTLWKKTEKQHEVTMSLHAECERDRIALHKQLGVLEGVIEEQRWKLKKLESNFGGTNDKT